MELKKREDEIDLEKVRQYTALPNGTRLFQYQYGLSVSFIPEFGTHWFRNGEEFLNGTELE